MTDTKFLEMIMDIYNNLSSEQKKRCDDYLNDLSAGKINFNTKTLLSLHNHDICLSIAKSIYNIKIDIANAENKKNGTDKQLKLIKSILKEKGTKECCKTTYIIKERQYCFDGYRIFVFNKICDGVPMLYNDSAHPDYIQVWFNNLENYIETARQFDVELELPDKGKLSAYIDTQKAIKKANKDKCKIIPYVFSDEANAPAVDARYLFDFLNTFPNGKLYWNGSKYVRGCYGKDEKGNEMFLLPIKRGINDKRTIL